MLRYVRLLFSANQSCCCNSGVEYLLGKEEVGSSNLLSSFSLLVLEANHPLVQRLGGFFIHFLCSRELPAAWRETSQRIVGAAPPLFYCPASPRSCVHKWDMRIFKQMKWDMDLAQTPHNSAPYNRRKPPSLPQTYRFGKLVKKVYISFMNTMP